MTVSNLPIYPQLPLELQAIAINANTDIITPDGNIVELVLPADIDADGAQLVSLWALPRANSMTSVLYFYVSTDGGATKRLALAQPAPADLVSPNNGPLPVYFQYNGARISNANPYFIAPGTGGAKTHIYVGISVALVAGWMFHVQVLKYVRAT